MNVDDNPIPEEFLFPAVANSGRNSRHVDPCEPGCATPDGVRPVD